MSLIFDLVLHLVMCTSYVPNCTVISVCLDLCISSQVSLSPKSMLFLLNPWYFPIAYSKHLQELGVNSNIVLGSTKATLIEVRGLKEVQITFRLANTGI